MKEIPIDEDVIKIFKGREFVLRGENGKMVLYAHFCSDINPDPESHWLPVSIEHVDPEIHKEVYPDYWKEK